MTVIVTSHSLRELEDLWLYIPYMAALPEDTALSVDFLESAEQARALLELLETASGEGEEYLEIYCYYYRDDEGVQMRYILPFNSSEFTEDFLAAFAAL